jgi:hypothetical protein
MGFRAVRSGGIRIILRRNVELFFQQASLSEPNELAGAVAREGPSMKGLFEIVAPRDNRVLAGHDLRILVCRAKPLNVILSSVHTEKGR